MNSRQIMNTKLVFYQSLVNTDQIDLILMVPGQKVLHSLQLTSELGGLGLPANVRGMSQAKEEGSHRVKVALASQVAHCVLPQPSDSSAVSVSLTENLRMYVMEADATTVVARGNGTLEQIQ